MTKRFKRALTSIMLSKIFHRLVHVAPYEHRAEMIKSMRRKEDGAEKLVNAFLSEDDIYLKKVALLEILAMHNMAVGELSKSSLFLSGLIGQGVCRECIEYVLTRELDR